MTLSTKAEDRAAVALLAMLIVAAFANVVFGGKSLVPSENWNPIDPRINEQNCGPDFVPAEEWARRHLYTFPHFRDAVAANSQMEPSQEFLRRSLLRGEFPFWDPHVGAGSPSFASLVPAYLFPPSLLVVLLGNGSLIRNVYILALILCAGGFTYLLLRKHALGWLASLAGAVAFMFTGAVIQTAPSGIGQPVVFFSLALLVTARLVERASLRRAAELAIAFAFIALASFPPVLVQIFGCCLVYVFLGVQRQSGRSELLKWFAIGVVLSLAIVSVVYLPAFAVMSAATHVAEFYSLAAETVLEPKWILQLLSPTIMGGPLVYAPPPFFPDAKTGAYFFHTGAVALLLAGIGFLAKSDDRARLLKATVVIAGALALAKMFGLPPVHWIRFIPLLRTIHYASYLGILIAWAVVILAAFGVDALVRGRARRWHVLASGAMLAVAVVALRVFAHRRGIHLQEEGWRWFADYRLLVLFALFAFGLALFGRRAWASASLILVLSIEGTMNSAYPRPRRWNVWQHPPPLVRAISTSGRVLPMPGYAANTHSVFRHMTIDSLLPFNPARMHAFYRRHFSPEPDLFLRHTRKLPKERILDVANVEFVVIWTMHSETIAEASRRGYDAVYIDDFVRVMRRRSMPRYTFTTDYRVVPPETALAQAGTGAVLLEEAPSFPARPAGAGNVRLVDLSLNEVTLAVDAPAAGLVVCSEANMKGWRARVDDRPARILAANYAFRAVEVPPGRHIVRLRYHPPAFRSALAISIAGLLVCAWGLLRRAS